MGKSVYKRILLKLSREALAGDQGTGINAAVINQIAMDVKAAHDTGVQIGLVIGEAIQRFVGFQAFSVVQPPRLTPATIWPGNPCLFVIRLQSK